MSIIGGSLNGVIKVWDQKSKTITHQWGLPTKKMTVDQLQWLDESQNEIVVAYENGDLSFFRVSGDLLKTFKYKDRLAGLHVLHQKSLLLGCTFNGEITTHKLDGPLNEPAPAPSSEPPAPPPFEPTHKITLNRPTTCTLYSDSDFRILLAGGQGRLATLLDIETTKPIWTAKNVPHDFLGMEVPIWDKAIDWVEKDKKVFVSVTAHHQIRLYDTRAKRRPVMTRDVGTRPFVCVKVNPLNNTQIASCNTTADLQMYDLRKNCVVLGRYKGIAGSVHDVVFEAKGFGDHPYPLLGAVGLDRYFHLFDVKTRKHVDKHYAKLRFHRMLISTNSTKKDNKEEENEKNGEEEKEQSEGSSDYDEYDECDGEFEGEEYSEDVDEEDENVFDELEVIGDKPPQKKRPRNDADSAQKNKKKK
eukprot:TRINITY_DN2162_c0_g1_i1.p1 TRINITY_DN2162_c0_g1~~TRINITY_DN2162_c0_g1_i1.p1  ORF type:complete len:416 (-),score=102.43 TRINITY_DN2162_c0_g1_i1:38-1285(-)